MSLKSATIPKTKKYERKNDIENKILNYFMLLVLFGILIGLLGVAIFG